MTCQDNHITDASQPTLLPQLDLAPVDWFLATWRELSPLSLPEPGAFDLERCAGQLKRTRASRIGGYWDWDDVEVPLSMGRREAQLWLGAMLEGVQYRLPKRFLPRFLKRQFDGDINPDKLERDIRTAGQRLPGKVLPPLLRVFSPVKVVDLLLPGADADSNHTHPRARHERDVAQAFALMVLPYLDAGDRQELRERLRPELRPERWQTTWSVAPPLAIRLAALLGFHAEIEAIVSRWNPGDADPFVAQLDIILGLGDPKRVEQHARRLGCEVTSPRQLRGWLAHTELSALDWVEKAIRTRPGGEIVHYLDVLCLVKSPAVAAMVLELKQAGLGPRLLRRWLDSNVGTALAGLLPLAAGRGKLAEAALDFVQRSHQRGHTALIEDQLRHAPADAAGRVRRLVLERPEKNCPPFDAPSMPSWLYHAQLASMATELSDWVVLDCLPPLVIGEHRLNAGQVSGLLGALKGKRTLVPGMLDTLKRDVGAERFDAFSVRLFELWQGDGYPTTDSWVLSVVGTLGGDGCAMKLAAAIREWVKRRLLALVQQGLDTLSLLGSETALLQLNALAQQGSQRWVRERALVRLSSMAQARNLTQDQLDDLAVPDLGLDRQGGRDLDFGPRHFRILLAPDLRPLIRDEAGHQRGDLPKPRKDDNGEKAENARREWNLFKLQLRESIKLQAQRLERSLVQNRRWSVAEFRKNIGQHPLMARLARRLLWGGFDEKDRPLATFRVTEEGAFADMHDRECSIDALPRIGLIHPAHLSAEQRHGWGELFGDYEIVPPFPQLGRPVHMLKPEEEYEQNLRVGTGVLVSDLALLGGLSPLVWKHHWAGIRGQARYYPGHDVTAVLELSGWRERALGPIRFFRGQKNRTGHLQVGDALMLGELDPALLSEVAAEVTRLAAKGHVPG